MVFVKIFKIFCTLFLNKIGVEIMLSYGLEWKGASEDRKMSIFSKSKTWIFSKGVNPWFVAKKLKFFLVYFLLK